MKAQISTVRLIGLAAIASAAAAIGVACSADNGIANPAPTGSDSGTGPDGAKSRNDSGTGPDSAMSGNDSGTGADGTMSRNDSGSSSDGSTDSGPMMDVIIIDTDGCVSDAANCNSCYTPLQARQDPYNACSPYTVSCKPFANKTRIMGLSSDGGLPLLP